MKQQSQKPLLCPFTILVDTAETFPFTFQGLRADSDQQYRPLIVETKRLCLGRFPSSLGDYTTDGGYGKCHVERKSMDDAHGTILGWSGKGSDTGRRERFESELGNLAKLESALVVVECSLADLIRFAPAYGKKSPEENRSRNAKNLFRSVLAFQQDFRVPWFFCESRRLAEQATFRFLQRFHRNHKVGEQVAESASVECVEDIEQQLATL